MSEPTLRVLVVEDEPVARRGVTRHVNAHPEFEVARECANGREAVEALRAERFDVVLLDVEMPELSGLDVVEAIGVEAMPSVIFVTAFDRYALQAFDAHALDYVLKPIDPERFARALDRAARASASDPRRLRALLEELDGDRQRPTRIAARGGGRVQVVPVEEIDWIEAADNYVRLHVGGRIVLHREGLAHLAERLGPERFLRIHRSYLVPVDRIRELRSASRGDARLVLKDGTALPVSRRFRACVDRALRDGA